MNFLSTPKKDPMTPKARCKAWTTQTQNRKGGGEKKAPQRERERERERESATTPLNLLTSARESLKKKKLLLLQEQKLHKALSPLFDFLF
jgi:hypothetical protein